MCAGFSVFMVLLIRFLSSVIVWIIVAAVIIASKGKRTSMSLFLPNSAQPQQFEDLDTFSAYWVVLVVL